MEQAIHCKGEVYPAGGPGLFLLGRAEEIAQRLASEYEERVQLIYLDPPFGTGDTFSVKLAAGKTRLTIPAYSDTLGQEEYLSMMRAVLTACKRLLARDGSLYLHIDYRMSHQLRFLLDEIFGAQNFMNEIVWAYKSGGRSTRHYSRKHDTILFYRKSKSVYFNIAAVGTPRGPEKRNNMKRSVDAHGRVCFSIRSGGKTYTYTEDTPVFPSDVWDDVEHLHQRDPERTGFSTQKPEALLRRIILASSRPGDLVCDLFSGSGTTAAVAAKLGRRFLVCDASPVAMQLLRARQLVSQSEPTFFDGGQALRILYDAPPYADLTPQVALQDTEGILHIVYHGAGEQRLAYLAAGERNQDGLFCPRSYALSPTPGTVITLPHLPNACMQACNYAGQMAFFQL